MTSSFSLWRKLKKVFTRLFRNLTIGVIYIKFGEGVVSSRRFFQSKLYFLNWCERVDSEVIVIVSCVHTVSFIIFPS